MQYIQNMLSFWYNNYLRYISGYISPLRAKSIKTRKFDTKFRLKVDFQIFKRLFHIYVDFLFGNFD